MTLIDTRGIAAEIRRQAGDSVAQLSARGVVPRLATVVATGDPATASYARSIAKAAAALGIAVADVSLAGGGAAGLLETLDELSADPGVHAIVCLTPLPEGLAPAAAGAHINPGKDVDGANPTSLGALAAGLPAFAPATALAALEILRSTGTLLKGAEAVVVGRSIVVGKPLALLLLAENATVTVCHSQTRELAEVTRRADILVVATGHAHLIGAEHVRAGAVVIDVGTNWTSDGGMVGDVDTAAVEPVAASVTPVPGGVGPVTTAVLLRNVATAARAG